MGSPARGGAVLNRIRVLRLIARMNVGGPALQVVNLSRGLDVARFDHRLLVGSVGPDEGDYLALRAPDVAAERVTGLGRSPRPGDDVRALVQIGKAIAEFRPHIVHTHTAKAGALGRVAARRHRVPAVVHTFHGHVLHGYFSPRVTRAVVLAERVLARGTTRLLAVGAQVRDDLLAAGIGRPSQYLVVPPGVTVAPPPDRSVARHMLAVPPDGPVVAFIGRLTAIKRPDRFLEAAKLVSRSVPGAHFVVAGDGDLAGDLRRGGTELGGRLHLLGWRSDVETVHAAADVVVLTSDAEGMPVSLIEAALLGRPVVSTRVGSAAEVVADTVTGLVVARDAAAVADAVVALLGDARRREVMGAAAKRRAQELFSADRLVADTTALYEALVSR